MPLFSADQVVYPLKVKFPALSLQEAQGQGVGHPLVFYFVITPQAMRSPEFPAGSVL
jgi:hypothetical protein